MLALEHLLCVPKQPCDKDTISLLLYKPEHRDKEVQKLSQQSGELGLSPKQRPQPGVLSEGKAESLNLRLNSREEVSGKAGCF